MVKNRTLSDETSLKRLMTSDPNLGPNVVDREEEEGVSPSIELKVSTPLSSFLANHIMDSKSYYLIEIVLLVLSKITTCKQQFQNTSLLVASCELENLS